MSSRAAQTAKYLKVSEVAAYLNLSTRQIYDLVTARVLESSKFGQGRRGIRVPSESVLKFEADRKQPATSPAVAPRQNRPGSRWR